MRMGTISRHDWDRKQKQVDVMYTPHHGVAVLYVQWVITYCLFKRHVVKATSVLKFFVL